MKRLATSSILALGLAAGMAGLAHAQQGVSDTEIVIGSNGDLSGAFAAFNVGAVRAAQMKFDEVNANGGIHGRKIRFIVEDHGYQVPKAVQNFNKLINSDQAFAMILNLGTPHNIAGFQLMESKKIHNLFPLSAGRQMLDGDITYKWTGSSDYYDQLRAAVRHFATERGVKNVCAMYFPTDYGQEVFEGTRDEVAALGLNYAAETTHRPDEQDFVGAITKLKEAGCEMVSIGLGVRQTIVAVGTAKKLGFDVPFIGCSAGFNTAIAKVPGGVTEGYYAAGGWSDLEARIPENEELRKWAEAYQAKFGTPADTAAQLGGSAANTLVMALEAAGRDLTPESFSAAMESLSFYDPIMDVDNNYDDHRGADLIVLSQIQDGMWKEVARLDPSKQN